MNRIRRGIAAFLSAALCFKVMATALIPVVALLSFYATSPPEADAVQILPLSATLQNGSFEQNPNATVTTPAGYFVATALMPGWETDDPAGQFEIWRSGFSPGGTTTVFNAVAGNGAWFCELNANVGPPYGNPSIWQDISTTPGAIYKWSFWHRGRNGQDTAMLLLGAGGTTLSTADAQFAADGSEIPDLQVTNRGAQYLVARMTGWTQHYGYYPNPNSSDVAGDSTRFQLYSYSSVAGPTGSSDANKAAEGNLVDAASWDLVAAPTTYLTLSGNTPDPNIVAQVDTLDGYYGVYVDPSYDFTTPGSIEVDIDIYDADDNLLGTISSTVNIYAYLELDYVNAAGETIASSSYQYYPANYADNVTADFLTAGAFDYDESSSPPPATLTGSDGIGYRYRSLSEATDPTGASAPLLGSLTQNESIIYVYEPQPQTLAVMLIDESGNVLNTTLAIQTLTLPNGSDYLVTADGGDGNLTYPLSFTDDGGTVYNMKEIADSPLGPQLITDPPLGTMDSDKYVAIVYSEAPAPSYLISGVVSGLPAGENAGVTINYTINGVPGSTTTNDAGTYTISDIPAGSEVDILPPADIPDGSGGSYRCSPIAGYYFPSLGMNSYGNNFYYVDTFAASGTVSGLPTVSGTDYNVGISIDYVITGPQGTVEEGSVNTGPGGAYEIDFIPLGSSLTIVCPADVTDPTGAGSYMGHPQAGYVHTDIDANLPNNDFAYGLRYSASGNVSGLPNLLGIQIDYQIIDPERTVTTGSVLTDASGNYLIENIKVGSLVTVYPLPNETVTTLTGPVLYAATPLTGYYDELADTDITNLDFIYVPTYTASGTVKGLPDDAGVQIDYVIYGPITGDQRPGTVYTDSNGYYEIPGIPERGRITITAPVRLFEPGEGFYDSDDSGGYDLRNVGDNMPGNDFNYFTEDPGGETPPPNPRPPVTPVTPTPPAPTPRVPVPAPAPAPQPGTRMPRTGDFVNIFGLLLLGLLAAAALGKLGYDQYKTRGVRKD